MKYDILKSLNLNALGVSLPTQTYVLFDNDMPPLVCEVPSDVSDKKLFELLPKCSVVLRVSDMKQYCMCGCRSGWLSAERIIFNRA